MRDTSSPALHVGQPWAAGTLLRLRDFHPEAQIVCGYRSCAARIATLHRDSNRRSRHYVALDAMFERTTGRDGQEPTVVLRERFARQWERARKLGQPWSRFRPQNRRPRRTRDDPHNRSREVEGGNDSLPPIPFRFVCPSCGRPNLATVPATCTAACRFHCPRCGATRHPDRPEECTSLDPMTLEPCMAP